MEGAQQFARTLVRFGAFEVDLRAGELRKQGTKIKLQQQPFRVLALLLERPGQVVTREELRRAIWPNTVVEFEDGVDAAIYKLRNALGDSAEHPRFVETLPRRGYRFIAALDGAVALEGEQDSPALKQRAPKARLKNWTVLAGGLGVAVALSLIANTGGLRNRLMGRATSGRIHSIAVLPLRNLSSDPAQEYFADGMTEALITNLGKIGGVRVISRTSAMHYKASQQTLPEIGRQLDVDAVVEGAVLREDNRVRITAQLVETSSDRHLWAESFESDLRNVLAVQDQVARAITNEIKSRLSLQEQTRLTSARPVNPEAYEAYLKGRYEWNAWTEQGLKKSLEYFAQAIQQDPGYAPAWAGLADAHQLMGLFGFVPRQVSLPRAKEAALKALQLDETLSDAHVSLAFLLPYPNWDWPATENELRRAIRLNPNNAQAHQSYGYFFTARGQLDAAIEEMKSALELDPLSPNKQASLGGTLYRAGRYDEALHYLRQVPDTDANSESRHRKIATIYERKEMWSEALGELLTALRVAGKSEIVASVEQEYLSSGYSAAKKTFLRADVRETERRARSGYPRPNAVDIAADYALLGEKDQAFEWLETAFRDHEGLVIYLKTDDRLESLRSDARFADLVRRIGLPP
jgi:TolB-like protein/DNA-binding winged helix-turn-helix (wHTH) protein/Flp pilus assembly protein TadD